MQGSELVFIESSHEYFLGLKRLPSVSEIMRPLTEPAMALVPPHILEVARDRGTRVHRAIEEWVKYDVYDEEVKDYLDQFILMLVENGFKVLHSELMLSDGEYAGTLDLIVKNDKNDLYIIDTKTTHSIASYVPIQLGAYFLLAKYNGLSVKGCYVLHLKPDQYNLTFRIPDTDKWKELHDQFKNQKDQYTK